MRLFLYGTLLDDDLRACRGGAPGLRRGGTQAVLRGWQRVQFRGTPWPTLRRRRGSLVHGVVVHLGADAAARLGAWEGPPYRLRRVAVQTAARPTAAYCWIAPGGTARAWETIRQQGVRLTWPGVTDRGG